MNDLFQDALVQIKARTSGLPGFCRLVMYELLEYCDFKNAIISIGSMEELARKDFQVSIAPGRKKEVITADTIRNAFRTIKKARPDDFIFKVVNQRIIIEMPFLRELYLKINADLAAANAIDIGIPKTLASIEEFKDYLPHLSMDDVREDAAASCWLESNNKNKNKTTTTEITQKLIPENFYPDETTIAAALKEGLNKVMDQNEIEAFINYNQAKASLFSDFNPVYLRWLRRGQIHEQEQKAKKEQQLIQTETHGLRRFSNATSARKHSSINAVQKALLLNQQIIDDDNSINASLSPYQERYSQTLDEHDFIISTSVYQQAWRER